MLWALAVDSHWFIGVKTHSDPLLSAMISEVVKAERLSPKMIGIYWVQCVIQFSDNFDKGRKVVTTA